jgi:hypothetical protein
VAGVRAILAWLWHRRMARVITMRLALYRNG